MSKLGDILNVIEDLECRARGCVEYVGSANYPEREKKAVDSLSESFEKAIKRVREIMADSP